MLGSCSHKFDSNILGLDFYQWNLWLGLPSQGKGIACQDPGFTGNILVKVNID